MRTAAALLCCLVLAGPRRAEGDAVDLLQKARSLASEDRHGEAIEVYVAALAEVEAELGPASAAMAVLQKELAEQHRALGRLSEAEALVRRSLAIEETALGPDHLAVAISLTRLASLCERQERRAEARALAAQAQGILESECGPNEEGAAGRAGTDDACPAAQRSHRELRNRLAAGGSGRVARAAEPAAEGPRLYRVQLASHQDRAAAERELARSRQAHEILAVVPGRVASAEIGERGLWHRVQFGEFAAATEARRLCARLRERGQECLVVSDP